VCAALPDGGRDANLVRIRICATDGRTYDNPCLLECAGVDPLFQGSCDDPPSCIEQCIDAVFPWEKFVTKPYLLGYRFSDDLNEGALYFRPVPEAGVIDDALQRLRSQDAALDGALVRLEQIEADWADHTGFMVGSVAEWEERSPWAPLGERRGVPGNALTIKDVTGTIDVADITAESGAELLEIIGKSLAFPGTNAFIGGNGDEAEIMVCIAPPWADRIAADHSGIEDVQRKLAEHAALPLSWWPAPHRKHLEECGRVDARGMVPLVAKPEQMIVMVCGGLGNLHALALHSFGPTKAVTRPF